MNLASNLLLLVLVALTVVAQRPTCQVDPGETVGEVYFGGKGTGDKCCKEQENLPNCKEAQSNPPRFYIGPTRRKGCKARDPGATGSTEGRALLAKGRQGASFQICAWFPACKHYFPEKGCREGDELGGKWRLDKGKLGPCGSDQCCLWQHKDVPIPSGPVSTWFVASGEDCRGAKQAGKITGPYIMSAREGETKNICVKEKRGKKVTWKIHKDQKTQICQNGCCLY